MSTIARLRSLLAKRDAADPNGAEWIDAATDFVNARADAIPALLECAELLAAARTELRSIRDRRVRLSVPCQCSLCVLIARIDHALAALEEK